MTASAGGLNTVHGHRVVEDVERYLHVGLVVVVFCTSTGRPPLVQALDPPPRFGGGARAERTAESFPLGSRHDLQVGVVLRGSWFLVTTSHFSVPNQKSKYMKQIQQKMCDLSEKWKEYALEEELEFDIFDLKLDTSIYKAME